MLRFTLNNTIEGHFVCPTEPMGWDSGTLSLIRSPLFHGVNYTRSLSLQFLCNAGKEYIDNIYETQGIDAEVSILVEDSCDCVPSVSKGDYNSDYNSDYSIGGQVFDCDWVEFFSGILNLKEYNRTERITDVSIIEQSLNQKLTSRMETDVDVFGIDTVDGETFSNITTQSDIMLHSKALTYVADFQVINDSDNKTFPDAIDVLHMEIPLYVEGSEGFTDLRDQVPPYLTSNDDTGAGLGQRVWSNETGQMQTIEFEIDIDGYINVSGGGNISGGATSKSTSLQIRIGSTYDAAPGEGGLYFIKPTFSHLYTNSFTAVDLTTPKYTVSYNVGAGKSVFLTFVIAGIPTNTGSPFPWFVETHFDKFSFKLKNVNTTEESEAKGTLVYETMARVLQGILSIEDPLRSSYYGRIGATPYEEPENGDGSFTMTMDGFRIRQYPLTGASGRTPKFNFKQLFDTFNALDDIGFGFEKLGAGFVGRIETKDFFYTNNKSLTLTKVPNVKISVASELYVNNIEIGFDKWQTNGINGLDEYCARSQYTTALKTIDNTFDRVSPGIGSAYILEELRRKPYDETLTEDTEYDTELFITALNRSVGMDGAPSMLDVAEKNENFTVTDNILDPSTVYNLRWTVVRNLIRNMSSISPSLVKNAGRAVKFTSGEANYKTVTAESDNARGDYAGEELSGEQNVVWDNPDVEQEPLYVPEWIEFDYPLEKSEFTILQNQPYDYIEVDTGKTIYYGYIEQVDYKPKSGLTTFKLKRRWQ